MMEKYCEIITATPPINKEEPHDCKLCEDLVGHCIICGKDVKAINKEGEG
jgi:hypothetical protein